jgi:hypothetical protein
MALFIGLPLTFQWLFQGAPRGATARIVVSTYVDGSQISAEQKQVVTQLASEYTGAIEFHTIDIDQHPEVKTGDNPVTSTPTTRFTIRWCRKDGSELRSEYIGINGPAPKREMVREIGYMSQFGERFWPSAVIHRRPRIIIGN